MSVIGSTIDAVLLFAIMAVIARFIIEWVSFLARDFRPSGILAALFELIYTLTDPAMRAMRKVIPPIRLGQVMLDLSAIVLLLGLNILRGINAAIFF